MRILVCNWKDLRHPQAGGAEVYTHEIARRWVAAGHAVTLFCAAVDGAPPVEDVDGVRVVRRGGRLGVYRAAREYYRGPGSGRFDLVVHEGNTRPFRRPRGGPATPGGALIHPGCPMRGCGSSGTGRSGRRWPRALGRGSPCSAASAVRSATSSWPGRTSWW